VARPKRMTEIGATTRRRAWTPARGYLVFLIPPVLFLAMFFLWPLATVVYRGFFEPTFGLQHYLKIMNSSAHVNVLLYTFEVATTVTIICLVISYPLAYVISRAQGGLLYLCFALVLVPFWTSVVIRTYAWIALFQRRGLLNDLLIDFGIIERPVRFMYNNLGVHIGMVQVLLPFMVLPLLAAMRGIDQTKLRAAEVLGANPIRVFWHVYLPLSMPGVSAGGLLVFITAVGFYITPALLGGDRNAMVAVLIEQHVMRTLNWPLASALATVLLVLSVLLYIVYERVARRAGGLGVLG
jgi:ABC-type spermidine/putrescine transport system permease subunit I